MKAKPALWWIIAVLFVAGPVRADTIWFGLNAPENSNATPLNTTHGGGTALSSPTSHVVNASSGVLSMTSSISGDFYSRETSNSFGSVTSLVSSVSNSALASTSLVARGPDSSDFAFEPKDPAWRKQPRHADTASSNDGNRGREDDHNRQHDDDDKKVSVAEPGSFSLLFLGVAMVGFSRVSSRKLTNHTHYSS